MPTTKEEWQEFAEWMDDEGGLMGLLGHGVPEADRPAELDDEWPAILEAYEVLRTLQSRIYKEGGM